MGYYGYWGQVGDITGDGRDELVLFQFPKPIDNDDGPIDILALSWSGSQFEKIASVSLPRTYLSSKVVDLDNDGRAEIITLKSGLDASYKRQPIKLGVYSYVGVTELTLVDEIILPMEQDDNLGALWTQPLAQGGNRVVVPVPEKWVEGMDLRRRILEYRGFRFIGKRLIKETELLTFEWEYYGDNSLPRMYSPVPKAIVDINGSSGFLNFSRDRKMLELVKELPPASPKR